MSNLTIEQTPEGDAPAVSTADERALASLVDHPGWKVLCARVDEHEAAWGQRIAAQIVQGTKPIDNDNVLKTRGYFRGQRTLLQAVSHAAAKVEAEGRQT